MLLKSVVLAAGSALLVSSCATYTTTSRYWPEAGAYGPSYGWYRDGRVEWIRESNHVTRGNPGGGAVAGAVVGGLLGSMLTHGGIGTLFGAATGAAVGAGTSQGSSSYRTYEVLVRFDDGSSQLFSYAGMPPFRPGEQVRLTENGLSALADAGTPGPPPAVSQSTAPGAPPPPAPYEPSAVPRTQGVPSGQWVYTQQYGWAWMPYGDAYSYAPAEGSAEPQMYVYMPSAGWTWVVAPWLWGWGPRPYFGVHAVPRYRWYGHGWGDDWRGYRPAPYRDGFSYRGFVAERGGPDHDRDRDRDRDHDRGGGHRR